MLFSLFMYSLHTGMYVTIFQTLGKKYKSFFKQNLRPGSEVSWYCAVEIFCVGEQSGVGVFTSSYFGAGECRGEWTSGQLNSRRG